MKPEADKLHSVSIKSGIYSRRDSRGPIIMSDKSPKPIKIPRLAIVRAPGLLSMLYTPSELGKELGIPVSTIRDWIARDVPHEREIETESGSMVAILPRGWKQFAFLVPSRNYRPMRHTACSVESPSN